MFLEKMKKIEETISAQEAANALLVSKMTVIRWIKASKIPAYRLGNRYRIPVSAITDFIESSKVGKWE